ncbi:MAG: family 43 glycosylhydrolase [Clostridia bacterium]|nr:family 43 glycosylhydrolase [Clostridia bacterium]
MNPVLPREHFVPDSEARVMPDGRLYVYGSYDISGRESYCSNIYKVFSTDDLVHWHDHGTAFSVKDIPWASETSLLYAPDCIHRDGKYYLYFCLSDNTEGVAVSDCPYGPFKNPTRIQYASGDGIDPAIFVDDDHKAYYYWGQFSLRAAEMNADMKTLEKETAVHNLLDEMRHGFHEGASLRKYKNTYILLYTCILRGKATCLAHATSLHPLGPYTYRGIVIDNIGVDPQTWNNHGSIECFNGKWYVFYHRSSQNSCFSRRLCIEPIEISDDGFIKEVLPTSQGTQPPFPAEYALDASHACRLGGWGTNPFIGPDKTLHNQEVIQNASENGWAVFRYLDFSKKLNRVTVVCASDVSGAIEILADDQKISEIRIEDTSMKYASFSSPAKEISGVRTLYLQWNFPGGSAKILTLHFKAE